MAARLVFLRRTRAEAELQGGEVYFDINGRNVGKLALSDAFVDVPAGVYHIRMYKSHGYGAMVGFADATVEVQEGMSVLVRYSAPAVISQPGYIMLSAYSPQAADSAAFETERQIGMERAYAAKKEEEVRQGTSTAVKWIIAAAIATGVLIAIPSVCYIVWLMFCF